MSGGGWWQRASKRVLLAQAAQALRGWIRETGQTPEGLVAALQAGQGPALLETALGGRGVALAQAAAWVRPMRGALSQIGPEDYPQLLQLLAEDPDCAPHAEAIYWQAYRPFAQALDTIRAWLLPPDGNPPPSAPPAVG